MAEPREPRRTAAIPHAVELGASPTAAAALAPFDAVVFDLDGVVTDTARLHLEAWRELFDAVLADPRLRVDGRPEPFTDDDYYAFLDGRPREDGIAAFLAARGIALPAGSADQVGDESPGDGAPQRATVATQPTSGASAPPPDPTRGPRGPADLTPGPAPVHIARAHADLTVAALAAAKDRLFRVRLAAEGVAVLPGSVDLLRRLRNGGVRLALASSSRNARPVLEAAGLADAFDEVVDGRDAAALGLSGKPAPDLFLEAARRLGATPARTAVVEDAVAGVRAARAGGFGLVVGIDRHGHRALLEAAGADAVLGNLTEFDVGRVASDPLVLVYEGFDPAHEGHREALTALGNGYLGTRGAAPERAADALHYPGTYLAGVYNRLESVVQDHRVELEDMVNAPNWLQFDLRLGADWWSAGGLRIVEERRELDLRRAVLGRSVLLENRAGDRLRVRQRRIVSMADKHLAALETVLTAVDRDVQIQVRSGTDTTVVNANVPEDALLANRHLVQLGQGTLPGGTQYTEVLTSDSAIRIAVAVRTTARDPEGDLPPTAAGNIGWTLLVKLRAGIPVTVLKTAAFVTSRDSAISSPRTAALAEVARAPGTFAQLATRHHAAWHPLWRLFAVHMDADPQTQLVLNLHVFHLLQTITPHTADLDAGVPARGLHGEGYRGHVFWDELFVLPLVTTRLPSLTRELLGYRWRRLDAARDAARAEGLAGALFPWQCGSDGREETPDRLYNARSGRWIPDNSRRQRHVGLAVAFNAWSYAEATDDREWLLAQGADLLVEVARLFASLAEHDPRTDRFHLRGVMGPDEYHDGYPGRPGAGVDDNAYTNVMAAWLFRTVARLLLPARDGEWLSVRRRLLISPGEVRAWDTLSRRMFVPFHDGTISQFAGYADLAELDWEGYRRRYGNIERLDLILEAEGDTTNRYRLSKQADVLMLVYLLGADGLRDELSRLGYDVGPDELRATVAYYLARTANGSTLSRVAHASVLATVDPEAAWATYREALDADLDDTQGGTTRTGVHLGAMAGSIDVVQRSFAGLRMGRDGLAFAPRMPAGLRHVSFSVRYRGHLLHVGLGGGRLQLRSEPGTPPPVRVRVGARVFSLAPGGRLDVPIDDGVRGEAPPDAGPGPAAAKNARDPGEPGDAPASDPRTG